MHTNGYIVIDSARCAQTLQAASAEAEATLHAAERARRERDALIHQAINAGIRPVEVARLTGLTRGRISQIHPLR